MIDQPPFAVIVADPPWKFGDSLPGPKRGASAHYATMTVEDICDFELPELAHDCWLFLWRPATHAAEALDVAKAWGFDRAPSELIWRKVTNDRDRIRIGMGRSVRNAHETCLIFRRGKPERLSASTPSIFDAPRGAHSAKPEEFYRLVDGFAPGPKVELFARRQWRSWFCTGLEMPDPPTNHTSSVTPSWNEGEQSMAAKKKTTKRSPKTHARSNGSAKSNGKSNGNGKPDRTGMVQQELSAEEIEKRGKELAKQCRRLDKKVDEKKSTNKVLNEEIRGMEEVIAELSEQVDTGTEWVKAQTTIPGA